MKPGPLPTSFPLPEILAHKSHRFVDPLRRNIERRAKPNRILARAKRENSEIEEALPEFFARFWVGKIESEKHSPAAHSGNNWLFALQIAELIEKIGAHLRGVLDQVFSLDNAQIMGGAHHIGEISAPG